MQIRSLRSRVRQWGGELVCDVVADRFARRVRRSAPPTLPPNQLQIAGFYGRRNGISEGAELQRRAFTALGLTSGAVDASAALRNPLARSKAQARSSAVIAHANGRQVGSALAFLSPSSHRALRVGYCAWELSTPPATWGRFDAPLHEVWTPSTFSAEALARVCKAPIRVVRHVCAPPKLPPSGGMRRMLGLDPEAFVALVMADTRSSFARKNPLGAIEAFSRAFSGDRNAALIVKVSRPEREPALLETLKQATGNLRAIFVEDYLPDLDKWKLMQDIDVLLSLHRAEGFGIPMLEAMAVGKPVVATAWSGNLDYMENGTAILVPYHLVGVEDRQNLYAGGEWAEPDIDFAADALRALRQDQSFAKRLGAAARARAAANEQLRDFAGQLPEWALQLDR